MEILILLIPVSAVLVGVSIWAFLWAADHGQFEDLERQALDILSDEPGSSDS